MWSRAIQSNISPIFLHPNASGKAYLANGQGVRDHGLDRNASYRRNAGISASVRISAKRNNNSENPPLLESADCPRSYYVFLPNCIAMEGFFQI